MAIKYTKIFHCKSLRNIPEFGFLVWKYAIWQPWHTMENNLSTSHLSTYAPILFLHLQAGPNRRSHHRSGKSQFLRYWITSYKCGDKSEPADVFFSLLEFRVLKACQQLIFVPGINFIKPTSLEEKHLHNNNKCRKIMPIFSMYYFKCRYANFIT
jgi:hypothetical protein